MKLILPIALALVLALVAGGYFYLGNYMYVVAEEDLTIYSNLDSAMGGDEGQIGMLEMNDELQIVKCHDVKHYIVPEVITKSGERGYINGGRFSIQRERAGFTFRGHKIFGCP